MKIAFTVSDFGAAANVGGDVERRTSIVEIPDEQLPKLVREYQDECARAKKGQKWVSLSISLVEESA